MISLIILARVILIDEIRTLLEFVAGQFRIRNRAIIMMLKDTGLRRSDLSKMTVEDYLMARVISTERGDFKVFRPYPTTKTGEVAYVHIGPEAVEAVDKYLDGRSSGPLFLNRNGVQVYEGNMTMMVKRFARHLDNPDNVSPHSFRKTHRTLLEARMPESYMKKLQGKSTDPYIHPEQTGELTEAYIKHYDAITVFKEELELEALRTQVEESGESMNDLKFQNEFQRRELLDLRKGRMLLSS